jgi:hypothetical protein
MVAPRHDAKAHRSRISTIICAVIAVGSLAVTPAYVRAQTGNYRVGAGISWETYRFSSKDVVNIESLSLFTVPLAGRFDLARNVELTVGGAWARGELVRADGSTATIDGPTDSQVDLTVAFGRDRFTVTAIGMLPTGHESLTNAEAEVTGAIAADVLPFRISNWGTGGGVGLSTGFAAPIGSFAAGLSVGYVVAREFDLREGEEFAYRPGNQLHVRAAIDRTFGQSGKAALQVTVQRFDEDQVNGANLYQSGNR